MLFANWWKFNQTLQGLCSSTNYSNKADRGNKVNTYQCCIPGKYKTENGKWQEREGSF